MPDAMRLSRLPLRPAAMALALFVAAPAFGQDAGASAPELRDLSTDRPDTTESPFTVDKGHVQFETTLFGYARAPVDENGVRAQSYEFLTTNIRLGLTDSVEANVVPHFYGINRPGGGAPVTRGLGAIDLRAKFNFWGNGGGATALALLPFVSLPLDRHNNLGPADTEYGVLLPFSTKLAEKLDLGLNVGAIVRRNDVGLPYRVAVPLTASFAYEWTRHLGGYYEVAAEVAGGKPPSVSLNTGFTYQIGKNLQLDTGIGFGVSGDADRLSPFVGISKRF